MHASIHNNDIYIYTLAAKKSLVLLQEHIKQQGSRQGSGLKCLIHLFCFISHFTGQNEPNMKPPAIRDPALPSFGEKKVLRSNFT